MARPGEAFLAFVVKILTIGAVVVGAALIAAGCILQNPPRAPVPAGLVAVGVLSAASAAVGFAGVRRSRALLAMYIAFGAAATLAQAALVGAAFADPARVCDEILRANARGGNHLPPSLADADALRARLAAFRWIFLWVVLAQAAGLALAGGLFLLSKRGAGWEYDGMTAEEAQTAHLAAIRAAASKGDLKSAARSAGRGAARLAARMEQRYGSAAAEANGSGRGRGMV